MILPRPLKAALLYLSVVAAVVSVIGVVNAVYEFKFREWRRCIARTVEPDSCEHLRR